MNDNTDQFGRTNIKNKDDNSKKIEESLALIKEQLIKKNLNIEVNDDYKTETDALSKSVLEKLDNLDKKIQNLQYNANKNIQNNSDLNPKKKNYSNQNILIKNNIFSELDSQLKPLTGNAVMVINSKENNSFLISKINKLFFLIISFLFIYFLSVCILLLKGSNINNLEIFGKKYLINFLKLIDLI